MANSTYLSCDDTHWQASFACMLQHYKERLLAAKQEKDIIYHESSNRLTEEAVYMIFVMLIFVGLAVLGSSINAYEFFFTDNEKKTQTRRNGHNENITKTTTNILKTKNLSESQDYLEDFKSVLKCFCMVSNGRKILSTSTGEGQINCFHGLRFLNNVAVICCHTMFLALGILRHAEDTKPFLGTRAFYSTVHLALFSVDVFFLISGFLNAKIFFHKYSRSNGNISWFHFYIKRFLRLTPVYMIVLGFQATLLTYGGRGLLWPSFDTNPVCQKDWWKHLLYINNFEKAAEECMPWCWYLAVDMQFYIISPLFMISLLRWPRLGYTLIIAGIGASSIMSFMITYLRNLIDTPSQIEFLVNDLENFFNKFWLYFDELHVKPHTRIIPYLVGILLAYYLHKKNFSKGKTKNSAMTLCCGWIVTGISIWICFMSLYRRGDILVAKALYNATKHLFFSCILSWVVYLCLTGQSEFLNKCLSWKYFLPFSRISYSAYLIHVLIMARVFYSLEELLEFNITTVIGLISYFCVSTYAFAFFVAILFEVPVLNLLERYDKIKAKKS